MKEAYALNTPASRVDALRARHKALDSEIEEKRKLHYPTAILQELKSRKLRIKEELEGIREAATA